MTTLRRPTAFRRAAGAALGWLGLAGAVQAQPLQLELPFVNSTGAGIGRAIDAVRERFGYDAIHLGLPKRPRSGARQQRVPDGSRTTTGP